MTIIKDINFNRWGPKFFIAAESNIEFSLGLLHVINDHVIPVIELNRVINMTDFNNKVTASAPLFPSYQ